MRSRRRCLAVLESRDILPYLTVVLAVRLSCLDCSSNRMSRIGQNGGAKLTALGAESSHSRQARVERQDSQRCSAVAYSKLNCGTTPPLGSTVRRSITSDAQINRCSIGVDAGTITAYPSPARRG